MPSLVEWSAGRRPSRQSPAPLPADVACALAIGIGLAACGSEQDSARRASADAAVPANGSTPSGGAESEPGGSNGAPSPGYAGALPGEPSASPRDAGLPPPRDAAVLGAALRGVCWNPVPLGARHPEGLDYAGFVARDIPLMAELGVNVVRTYEPLLDRAVLDALWTAGIQVIDSVYPWGGDEPSVVVERVRAVADHPAILYSSVGNEWNYNGLYVGLSHDDALARVAEAARLIRAEDDRHPIATIYGELPSPETLAALPEIDVWGINAYRGISFGDLFDRWRELTSSPMFVAEYGADAYNASLPGYDPDSQALAVGALAREILEQTAGERGGAAVLGGTIFEWADEWWKDEAGSLDAQDVGGIAPGGGPYPDQVFNEEWWGLVDIERSPRPAFDALRAVFSEYAPR